MEKNKVSKYGWRPDLPDARDHRLTVVHSQATLPTKIDLTSKLPACYDQGQLGSCTGNAIAAVYEFGVLKQGSKLVALPASFFEQLTSYISNIVSIFSKKKPVINDFMPSRLFIYYNERVIEGTVASDAGAEIRDGIKTIATQGVCTEKTWPYVISKFAKKPSKTAYTEALTHQALTYSRVDQTLTGLKSCLASGYPIVFGFTVYESFESDSVAVSGKVPMPSPSEQSIGGHAVVLVGYDDAQQRFIVRNSWGTDWGMKGYFTMPYAYVTNTNLCDDFWCVKLVEG